MISCGGSHTFVVTVQENRRQQLAQMHRRASQLNVQQEELRLAAITTLGRRLSRRMTYERHASDRAIAKEKLQSQQQQAKKKADSFVRKCNSARRAEPLPHPVDPAVVESFSWKSRPLSSRLSVRNAFRQQNREMEDWRESMAPPDVLPPRTRSRLGVSPRLLRLSEQVGRRRKPAENPADTQAVADAVDAATANCLRLGSMGYCMESGSPKASARHDQSDEDDDALHITEIADGLRVETTAGLGGGDGSNDDDYDEDSDDEISLFPTSGRYRSCQAMETDIRTRHSH